jgi:hypothetical protein
VQIAGPTTQPQPKDQVERGRAWEWEGGRYRAGTGAAGQTGVLVVVEGRRRCSVVSAVVTRG